MSASEPDRINEVAPDLQGSTATAFDDIYLPGIGVRGALSDDAAESFDFRSNVGETCIRWAALVNNWAIQTVRSVRRIGSRLVVEVTNIGSQTAIKYSSKSLTQVTNWHTRYLPHSGWNLSNALQTAISRFRSATSALALLSPRSKSVTRIRQEIQSRLLGVAQSTSIQIQEPPVPTEPVCFFRDRGSKFARHAVIPEHRRGRRQKSTADPRKLQSYTADLCHPHARLANVATNRRPTGDTVDYGGIRDSTDRGGH